MLYVREVCDTMSNVDSVKHEVGSLRTPEAPYATDNDYNNDTDDWHYDFKSIKYQPRYYV